MEEQHLPKNYHSFAKRKRYVPKKLHAGDVIQILETPLDFAWIDGRDELDADDLSLIVSDRRKHGYARDRYIFAHARAATLVAALRQATTPKTQASILEILRWRPLAAFLPAVIPYLGNPVTNGTAAEFILNVVWSRNVKGKYNPLEIGAIILGHFVSGERDDGQRSTYALILGGLGYRPAIPALIEALSSTDTVVQACAASALGDLGATEAHDELQRLVAATHRDGRVKRAFDKISRAIYAIEKQ